MYSKMLGKYKGKCQEGEHDARKWGGKCRLYQQLNYRPKLSFELAKYSIELAKYSIESAKYLIESAKYSIESAKYSMESAIQWSQLNYSIESVS